MTPEDRAFKLLKSWYRTPEDHDVQEAGIADAIRAAEQEAAKAEREACAKIADGLLRVRHIGRDMQVFHEPNGCSQEIAALIRKRGQP